MRVLLVDDEPDILLSMQLLFRKDGIETVSTRTADQAMENLESVDCIVLDLSLPGAMNGWEFLDWLAESPHSKIPVVVCSGYSEVEPPPGNYTVLPKPAPDIVSEVKKVVELAKSKTDP